MNYELDNITISQLEWTIKTYAILKRNSLNTVADIVEAHKNKTLFQINSLSLKIYREIFVNMVKINALKKDEWNGLFFENKRKSEMDKLLKRLNKEYHIRVQEFITEPELIDDCKYMLYFEEGWHVFGEYTSVPVKTISEAIRFIQSATQTQTL